MTKMFAQLFNDTFLLQTNSILGTLAKPIKNKFDLILTNPPYVMSGSSNLKEEIAKQQELKDYFAISAMGIEGLFMEWIVRALKPGGKVYRAADCLKNGEYQAWTEFGVTIRSVAAYNQNHPKAECVGFLLTVEGKTLYMAGDTSRTEEMETELAGEHIDYAFLPIDGIYNMDAAEASECAAVIERFLGAYETET